MRQEVEVEEAFLGVTGEEGAEEPHPSLSKESRGDEKRADYPKGLMEFTTTS